MKQRSRFYQEETGRSPRNRSAKLPEKINSAQDSHPLRVPNGHWHKI
jgi:hypothetical protein